MQYSIVSPKTIYKLPFSGNLLASKKWKDLAKRGIHLNLKYEYLSVKELPSSYRNGNVVFWLDVHAKDIEIQCILQVYW